MRYTAEGLLDGTDWTYEEEFDLLKQEITLIADQCRVDETKKMVNRIEVRSQCQLRANCCSSIIL